MVSRQLPDEQCAALAAVRQRAAGRVARRAQLVPRSGRTVAR
jgi:hypothetical protein